MTICYTRRGSSRRAWSLITLALTEERQVIALDLPGHGESPALGDSGSFAGLARSLEEWLVAQGLAGMDMVGRSMGARLVLEMARRGRAGSAVALDPGGFWQGNERHFVAVTLRASGLLLRALRPALAHNAAARTLLLAQLAARPWALNGHLIAAELTRFADTATFDSLVRDLSYRPPQEGPAAIGSGLVTIGWGRHDRLCLPAQARRAQQAFPGSRLVWFNRSGHFPMWEQPEQVVRTILEAASGRS